MEFWSLYRIIRKRLWMVLFLVVITVGSTIAIIQTRPESYKANAVIRVAVTSPSVADVGRLDWYTAGILFSTIQETVLSRSILQEVVDANFLSMTVEDFRRAVGVSRVGNSNLLTISVKSQDPEMSKKLANDIATTFIRYNQRLLDIQSASSIAFYEEQVKLAESNYIKARDDFRNALNQPNARAAENQFISAQAGYHAALDKLDAARLLNRFPDLRPSTVSIAEPAVTPMEPEGRQLARYTLIALLVSLVLGVFFALGIEYLDLSIKSPYEVTGRLGIAVIGVIPHFKRGASGVASVLSNLDLPLLSSLMRWRIQQHESSIVPLDRMPARSAESFSEVRLNLVTAYRRRIQAGDLRPNLLVVTSSRPGDGKTTITANLGMALSKAGYRVLLIDSDLRNPQLHAHLGYDPEAPGLSDLLEGAVKPESAIRKTDSANLSVLPAGSPVDSPPEILDSDILSELISILGNRYDFVLFDSPAIGLYTDAAVIAARVGRALLVIDAARLSVENEARSLELLAAAGTTVEGVIVNKINPDYVDPMKLHALPKYLPHGESPGRNGLGGSSSNGRGHHPSGANSIEARAI